MTSTANERRAKIRTQLIGKKTRLEQISVSNAPMVPEKNLIEAHERRVSNAKIFLDELDVISTVLADGLNFDVYLVPRATLDKQVEKADFATVDFDGMFCKLYLIQNYPYGDVWLLYVAPVEDI